MNNMKDRVVGNHLRDKLAKIIIRGKQRKNIIWQAADQAIKGILMLYHHINNKEALLTTQLLHYKNKITMKIKEEIA